MQAQVVLSLPNCHNDDRQPPPLKPVLTETETETEKDDENDILVQQRVVLQVQVLELEIRLNLTDLQSSLFASTQGGLNPYCQLTLTMISPLLLMLRLWLIIGLTPNRDGYCRHSVKMMRGKLWEVTSSCHK